MAETSTAEEGELIFNYKEEQRKLRTFTWMPSSKIEALAFLSHGYGESLTPYYESLAKAGMDKGILCFGHDHTGHGLSEGERVQVESMEEYVRPVLEHCANMNSKYPGVPIFIVGHSMGGFIAINTVLEDAKQDAPLIEGMVLVGPLLEADPKMATPFKIFLARTFSKVWPGLQMGQVNRDHLTSDQTWLSRIKEDEKRWHGSFKALHSYILLSRLEEMKEEYAEIKLPLLLLHGEHDQVCTPEGSKRFFEAVSSTDKQIEIVPGAKHNLFLELDPICTQTVNQIWKWVSERQ